MYNRSQEKKNIFKGDGILALVEDGKNLKIN